MLRRATQSKNTILSMNMARTLESVTLEMVTPQNTGSILSY